jgi:CYTH domain-containing protein
MPIENERKFVLLDDGKLEQQLARAPGVTRSLLRQAYLDVSGLRIRAIETDGTKRHVFTYKREVDGQVVEIETDISVADFERLWSQRGETLQKARYSWPDGRFHWDVDFFKTDEGRTYFAQAEVEMPEGDRTPPPLPPPLAGHLLALAPAGDLRFTSKRLANRTHAESLLADIRTKGKIE